MSTEQAEAAGRTPPTARPRRRVNPVNVAVLTVVWVLLWDEVSLFLVLTGVLVAVLVGLVFPLPPIDLHGRFRPARGLRLLVRLLVDAFRASVDVVALAFRSGTVPRSSIVRVQLRSRSDLYLTQTAELVSLVPGTLVLEVHRASSTLYLHVLGATDDAAIETAVRAVLDAEARVLRTFGSAEEVAALEEGRPQPGLPTRAGEGS
ncbi:multisubunit sodium/proton antiporter, MrpE subunit [Friedmanniella luteola]|uniref:Multisubunit sodium/proton antiporter, MrpE subunit n=1 Tax=Friedmanniella luteola TaxID=546871 RepID=A0A1H1XT91_9ACTN|nr:Na+/H+ antiporter subunit E [Friedmanniella luteola]SDT12430.1 multisubunit sodium/proton antiporter, MrpE subunit [Friedmanniella luteola]